MRNLQPTLINEDLQRIKDKGYNTIFTFHNVNSIAINTELDSISAECLLFLRCIEHIEIAKSKKQVAQLSKRLIERSKSGLHYEIRDSRKNTNRKWCVYSINDRPSIAYIEQPSSYDPSIVFHSYLPTMDLTGFGFRINGDFSTEPSRKHIVIDDRTQSELSRIGIAIGHFIEEDTFASDCEDSIWIKNILGYIGCSQPGAILYQYIIDNLKNDKWIPTITGDKVNAKQAYLLPSWCNHLPEKAVKGYSSNVVIAECPSQRQVMRHLEVHECDSDFFFNLIMQPDGASQINQEASISIMLEYAKRQKLDPATYNFDLLKTYMCLNDKTVCSLSEALSFSDFTMSLESNISHNIDVSLVQWIKQKLGIQIDTVSSSPINNILRARKQVVKSWQTAESLCVVLEQSKGNIASDESKKNVGYDVLSIEPTGRKKYIEVKLLESEGVPFTLTNNEYSTAHLYADDYYLCLIVGKTDNPSVLYIQNPLSHIQLEKRVRVWEWVCSDYGGQFVKVQVP